MLVIQRYSMTNKSTLGLLFLSGKFECYMIELPWQNNKKRESCIPAGNYKVILRKEETPMTVKYRDQFTWFDYHIEIVGIPNRDYIYIHIANSVRDLNGCFGPGEMANNNQENNGFVSNSTHAYERIYKKMRKLLEKNKFLPIQIRDTHKLV